MDEPAPTITEIRQQALAAYQQIMEEFEADLDSGDSQAYSRQRKRLSKAARMLVDGQVMSAKEIDDKLQEYTAYIKGGAQGTRTMGDLFHDWLNGKEAGV